MLRHSSARPLDLSTNLRCALHKILGTKISKYSTCYVLRIVAIFIKILLMSNEMLKCHCNILTKNYSTQLSTLYSYDLLERNEM